jgi:MFS superfamily sulfate permease-like transporter
MQSLLKLRRCQGERLLAKRKSNLIGGLTALAVLLPQALVFVAASEVEHKAEFSIAVVLGTVAAALAISFLGKSSKSGDNVTPTLTDQNNVATLLYHSPNS